MRLLQPKTWRKNGLFSSTAAENHLVRHSLWSFWLCEGTEGHRKQVQAGLFGHETLAYFTMHMVHYFTAIHGFGKPFGEFVVPLGGPFWWCFKPRTCEKVLDSSLYKAYYSEAVIHSLWAFERWFLGARGREAQISLVLPDLCPLPDVLPA